MAPPVSSVYDLAYRGKTEAVKILINENPKLKTDTDANGRMLIHWAALGGHDDLVSYLLSLGFPTDPKDDMEMTPLILAASGGRDKVVNLLLNQGANVNAQTNDGHSALQYAASKNWKTICAALLEQNADINIADKRGSTPLHRSATKGNLAIVKLLLEYGKQLKIDQRDAYGNSALHLACEEDRQEEAKLLVSNGASIELTNNDRKTPLDLCNVVFARQLKELHDKTLPV
ncbi:26S proteasome non-ATPase regulatory subunit 10-like isoform X1 [Diprion similis]|uniref:26S proteasome non-ATPase regulatory subunit 10-like isoform X1 n=1 Tax=Diprion similis TaxID=362088 RepID=UPI001EF7BED8|nr:26S proteasome non-ATPase regulatory subunit 10-like isoform X1 [Diprion similis]